jgi:hypothetical protein
MSTTTVSFRAVANRVSVIELRRREEAAREIQRRRLGSAEKAVGIQQAHYANLVKQLDEGRSRLPDLVFIASALPNAPINQDPVAMEQHAADLSQLVAALERQVRDAIAAAEIALQRRQMLAAVWLEIHNIEAEIAVRNQASALLANRLQEQLKSELLQPLDKSATLEEAQPTLARLQQTLERIRAEHLSLELRMQSRKTAGLLSGQRVEANSAKAELDSWAEARASEAKTEIRQTINAALTSAKLTLEALPTALQLQTQFAIENAHETDHSLQITDLINRHRVRLDSIQNATQMLNNPPQYADDTTGAMESRWHNLVNRLEAVACGLDEWSNSLELEYHQVHEDCSRALQRAYAKANFIEEAAASGFQMSDGDDDLLLMDLEGFPGYWVEVRKESTDEGYATISELKTDSALSNNQDKSVTEAICKKLQAMANSTDDKVQSAVEIIEQKPVVTRAKRPRQQARVMSINPNA